jgi:hypothetical protein
MALHFSTSSSLEHKVVISIDPALDMTSEEFSVYLKNGGDYKCLENQEPTVFVVKALSPKQREAAEVAAGAYKRSELGRYLHATEPSTTKEKAEWHNNLSDAEKQAYFDYGQYINRVYEEMIKVACVRIEGVEGNPIDLIQNIKPEAHRISTITELVIHIQRLSLLGDQGK